MLMLMRAGILFGRMIVVAEGVMMVAAGGAMSVSGKCFFQSRKWKWNV